MTAGIDLLTAVSNPQIMQPRAFIFDVFGTLVDWRSSIARSAAHRFAKAGHSPDPNAFADAWRGQYQPAMERIRSDGRAYVPLDVLHRENLEATLAQFGLSDAFGGAELADFAKDWERLDPWPDVVAGLGALRTLGLIAPCSNGSIALMARLARHAGFDWDAIAGADIARDYKPKAAVYHASARALGLEPCEVMMVAAHEDDLLAAEDAGLQTGYIPRPMETGTYRDAAPSRAWTLWADDLVALAQKLAEQRGPAGN